MPRFNIPQWFYIPQQEASKISTASGIFDPTKAVQSDSAWVSTVPQLSKPKKKKILLADWTLEQNTANIGQVKAFIDELLEEGFDIYVEINGEPQPITPENFNISVLYNLPPRHPLDLVEQMHENFSTIADELIILDRNAIKQCSVENPCLIGIESEREMQDLVMSSSHDLQDVLLLLEESGSISLSSAELYKFEGIPLETLEKVKQVTLTDIRVTSDYSKFLHIFPNLETIKASANIASGLIKALELKPSVKIHLEYDNMSRKQQDTIKLNKDRLNLHTNNEKFFESVFFYLPRKL